MADPLPVTSDHDLVARIRDGDEAAFALVVLQHYERLCVIAERITHSDAAAEELVQDVLFRIWEQRAHWNVTSTLGGYLTIAVRNHALNYLQRDTLERRWRAQDRAGRGAGMHGQLSTPDEDVCSMELAATISRAIDELPPRCRQAYMLRRHHQLSCAEIAGIMQISQKTVEIQIGNALRILRKRLADWL